jgi:hypothetical protein
LENLRLRFVQRRAESKGDEAEQRRCEIRLQRIVLNFIVLRLLRVAAGGSAQHRIRIDRVVARNARLEIRLRVRGRTLADAGCQHGRGNEWLRGRAEVDGEIGRSERE